MAIAYKSAGSGVSTETNNAALSPLCPATVDANDILIAHVYHEGTTNAPSTPAGWTLLGGPYVIQTTIARHWVYGKIAAGTEDGAAVAFGTAGGTNQRGARVYSFSGWTSGAIADVAPAASFSHQSHATDPQMPTVTTTMAGSLAVALVGQNDNNAVGSATGESGGDWTEAVAEYTANLTPGLMMQLQTATPTANPGTISGGSAATTDDPVGVIGFELRATIPWTKTLTEAPKVFDACFTPPGTFPATGVLDDFERTENPLSQGGDWTSVANASTDGHNAVLAAGARANRTATITDSEAWATIETLVAQTVELRRAGSPANSYLVVATASWIGLAKVVADTAVTLATAGMPLAAGDKYGIRAIGSQIGVYVKRTTDPTWLQVLAYVDSDYASGVISIASPYGGDKLADLSGGAIHTKSLDATATATDATTKAATHPLSDPASAADAATKASGVALTEAPAASDASTRSAGKTQADSASGADEAARSATFARTVADAASAGDESARAAGATLAETPSVTDSASHAAAFAPTFAETPTVTDSLSVAEQNYLTLAETATAADEVAAETDFVRALDDAVSAADTPSAAATKALGDDAAASDSSSREYGKGLADAATLADQAALAAELEISDIASAGDEISFAGAGTASIDDTATATDEITLEVAYVRPIDDTAAAIDDVEIGGTEQNDWTLELNDSCAATDALGKGIGHVRSEAAFAADAISRAARLALSDTASVADSATKAASHVLADGGTVSEALSRSWAATLALSDEATLTDAIAAEWVPPTVWGHVDLALAAANGVALGLTAQGVGLTLASEGVALSLEAANGATLDTEPETNLELVND